MDICRILREEAIYQCAELRYSLWKQTCQVTVFRKPRWVGRQQYACICGMVPLCTFDRTGTLGRFVNEGFWQKHMNEWFAKVHADKIVMKSQQVDDSCSADGQHQYKKHSCSRNFDAIEKVVRRQMSTDFASVERQAFILPCILWEETLWYAVPLRVKTDGCFYGRGKISWTPLMVLSGQRSCVSAVIVELSVEQRSFFGVVMMVEFVVIAETKKDFLSFDKSYNKRQTRQ